MHQWSSSERVYFEGRGRVTHCFQRVNLHYGSNSSKQKRKVRCYDVPSAFVNTDIDEDVLIVLKGELAQMMVQIAPQVYRKYMTVDRKGTPML